MITGRACKIVDLSHIEMHGESMIHLVGMDILEDITYQDTIPSDSEVKVPFVTSKILTLVSDLNKNTFYNTNNSFSLALRMQY